MNLFRVKPCFDNFEVFNFEYKIVQNHIAMHFFD